MATATMTWEDRITDPKEREVFAALANPEWDFRTISGIAEDTRLSESEVANVLDKHSDLVRKALVPDVQGRKLFTLKDRPTTVQEALAFMRAVLAKSFR